MKIKDLQKEDLNTAGLSKGLSSRLARRLNWYTITVQNGYETSVEKALKQKIKANDLDNLIKTILVPVQKKITVKEGKQNIIEEKLYPGYVLINMKLTPQTWELVASIEGVRGFVKTGKYPRPLPEKEVQTIIKFMESEQPSYQASFTVGEAVKVTDGVFKEYVGNIQELDVKKGKVKVLISFLGREAPYELDFSQIKKL